MYKAALLALLCMVVYVSSQTLEEQETSFSGTQDDVALLESEEGPTREKRFLFKKKALGLGLGLGAGLGFVKGYKIGKLSNGFSGSSLGFGNGGYGGYGHGNSYGQSYGHGNSWGHGGSYGNGGSSYYPGYSTQHYHHHIYQTQPQPQPVYGQPTYNDYYNNYYNQAQGQGSAGQGVGVGLNTDGYTYNRPTSYDSQGSSIRGHKSFTVGAQWSGGLSTGHNGGQWR